MIDQFATEAFTLALQLIGTCLIAWLAVGWAFRRFKREKLWERRLTAYSELIEALDELARISGIWSQDELLKRDRSAEDQSRLEDSYRSAALRLRVAEATGRLLLPANSQKTLDQLSEEREAREQIDQLYEMLEHDAATMQAAAKQLACEGRKSLDVPSIDRGG